MNTMKQVQRPSLVAWIVYNLSNLLAARHRPAHEAVIAVGASGNPAGA